MCSRCQKKFFADSRPALLDKMRKHLWKEHGDWMRSRIKAGQRRAKKAKGNPHSELALVKTLAESLPEIQNPTGEPVIDVLRGLISLEARIVGELIKRWQASRPR